MSLLRSLLLLTRRPPPGACARCLATRSGRAEATAAGAAGVVDPRAVQALFERLERGAAPLIDANGGAVSVARSAGELRLNGGSGRSFILTAEEGGAVRLQSTATTGLAKSEMNYTYKIDATGGWRCVTDGHHLLDLLTRDVVYHWKGIPSW